MANIIGTGNNDSLVGTSGADSISAGEGNDTIVATEGGDTIDGGAGFDILDLLAQLNVAVNAEIDGPATAAGQTLIASMSHIEALRGGNCNDTLWGAGNGDLLEGGAGNDQLSGLSGNDNLIGGIGNDTLRGDYLALYSSFAGNDLLTGGNGDDSLVGGPGRDTFVYEAGWGNDTIADYEDGTDQIDMSAAGLTLAQLTITQQGSHALISDGNGNSILLQNTNAANIDETDLNIASGGPVPNIVTGTANNDSLVGTSGADSISAGDGNDTIVATAGGDTIDGGAGFDILDLLAQLNAPVQAEIDGSVTVGGQNVVATMTNVEGLLGGNCNDTLIGADAADLLVGNGGDDKLYGGSGSDTLTGGAGNDRIYGETAYDPSPGADRITGGAGDDSLRGGAGADTFVYQAGWGNDTIADYTDGTDQIDMSATGLTLADLTITQQGSNALISDGNGNSILLKGVDASNISAGDLNVGLGVAGVNVIMGTTSHDSLVGTSNIDSIAGGSGDDTILAVAAGDTVEAGSGNDVVIYPTGGDRIDLGSGDDVLTVIHPDRGNIVSADGGDGNDWLDISIPSANLDQLAIDLSDYAQYTGFEYTTLFSHGRNLDVTGTASGEHLIVGVSEYINGANSDFSFQNGLTTINAGNGDDLIEVAGHRANFSVQGGAGNDTIRAMTSGYGALGRSELLAAGGCGDDLLYGAHCSDTLLGGDGADTLSGGNCNDILTGGAGNDLLSGGNDGDTFVYEAGWGNDTIADYTDGTDQIDMSATGLTLADLTITQQGSDALIADGNGNSILLNGVNVANIDETDLNIAAGTVANPNVITGTANNDSLVGTVGADTLVGSNGDDTLVGGNGDDLLIGGAGADVLDGGSGNDTVSYADSSAGVNVTAGSGAGIVGAIDALPTDPSLDPLLDGGGREGGPALDFAGLGRGGAAEGDTLVGIENIIGSAFDDTIAGDEGDNRLTGGAGSDSYILLGGWGNDTITDFTPGEDTINLSASGLSFGDLIISSDGGNTLVSDGAGNTILLLGVNAANVDASAFVDDPDNNHYQDIRDIVYYSPTGDINLDGLLMGRSYAEDAAGGAYTISYSFPDADSLYNGSYYGAYDEPSYSLRGVSQTTITKFQATFEWLETITNLNFIEVQDSGTTAGTIRPAWTSYYNPGAAAWGYYPAAAAYAGDIWFSTLNQSETSEYFNLVYIHELGHALGLKHSFSPTGSFGAVEDQYDGWDYTVMSYSASARHPNSSTADLMPQTFMSLDIQALQYLYGVDYNSTSGNNSYIFDQSERHYLTIYDSDGTDTLGVTGGNTDVHLDLTPGSWSNVGTVIHYSGGLVEDEPYSVFIMDGVVIENAFGANGDDTLVGNDADNILTGGAGADVLEGGAGDDSLVGGEGADIYRYHAGWGDDTIAGFMDGEDTVDLSRTGLGFADLSISQQNDDALISDGSGNTILLLDTNASNITAATLLLDSSIIAGTAGDDSLSGTGGPDVIQGLNGADTLLGLDGNDSIDGGLGEDRVVGGNGDDRLLGGEDADVLYGDAGNDTLLGGEGNDTIYSGDGDDLALGGDGNDRFHGSAGADTLDGGANADAYNTVDYSSETVSIGIDLMTGTGQYGQAAGDVYRNISWAIAGSGDDTIVGDDGRNYLTGLGGDDIIYGNGGNDAIWGKEGNDTIYGGDGYDQISGYTGDDLIYGGNGDDWLTGHFGLDTLYGGDGSDTAAFMAASAAVYVNLATGEAIGGQANGDILVSIENLYGGYGNDTLIGDDGQNTIQGSRGDDHIILGAGDDVGHGDDDNDTLEGGDGNDSLHGGWGSGLNSGDDVLIGGAGDDTLRGGDGADRFVYEAGWGNDIIFGYNQDVDQIDMSGSGLAFADLTITQEGSDALISDGNGNSILLRNTAAANIDAADLNIGTTVAEILGITDPWTPLPNPGYQPTVTPITATIGDVSEDMIVAADEVYFGQGIGQLFESQFVPDLNNSGLIWLENSATATAISGGNWGVIINSGTIVALSQNGMARAINTGSFGDLQNTGEIYAFAVNGSATGYRTLSEGDWGYTRFNSGIIHAWSENGYAYGVSTKGSFDNSGTIIADGYALSYAVIATTFNNTGIVQASAGIEGRAYGVYVGQVNNSGQITADIAVYQAADIINTGTITGDIVSSSWHPSSTTNTGTINGDILYGTGDDTFDSTGGYVYGIIDLGSGTNTAVGSEADDYIITAGGADHMSGGNGDDTLEAGAGDDSVAGGAGADVFVYGEGWGNDTIGDFEAGVDLIVFAISNVDYSDITITQQGGNALISYGPDSILLVGANVDDLDQSNFDFRDPYGATLGDDCLYGTAADDTIYGDDGNDTIYGLDGKDLLSGGNGDDDLYGGDGNDLILGNDGNDYLFGDAGNDTLVPGTGDDTIVGGDGIDLLSFEGMGAVVANLTLNQADAGSNGNFRIYSVEQVRGSHFNDDIVGSNNSDTISGGDGNDSLNGVNGDDVLFGGSGRDTLAGGSGDDTAFGEGGNDKLFGGQGDDLLDGGDGYDSLEGGTGNDSLVGGNSEDTLFGDVGDDTLIGGTGDDRLFGEEGQDVLYGGDGNDWVDGGLGADTLYGGDGNDKVFGRSGGGLLDGGNGDDRVIGGNGDDRAYGGCGDDSLFGYAGNDTIDGGQGVDTAFLLNENHDTNAFWADLSAGLYSSDGGSGLLLNIENIQADSEDDTLLGSAGDNILKGVGGADFIDGRDGDDSINGGAGDDTLIGGLGDDTLYGSSGNNIFVIGENWGNDVIRIFQTGSDLIGLALGGPTYDELTISQQGSDVLISDGNGNSITLLNRQATDIDESSFVVFGDNVQFGTSADDVLTGTSNDDALFGQAGNDLVRGLAGQDTLSGGDGDDTLDGGFGDDLLSGGLGDDIIRISAGHGDDTLTDYEDGDRIEISGAFDYTVTETGDDVLVALEDGGSLYISNASAVDIANATSSVDRGRRITGTNRDDALTGTGGDDTIDGRRGNDSIRSGAGNDDVVGDRGNDTIEGGAGSDTLSGGDDNDWISGDGGNDLVTGGSGADTLFGGDGRDILDGGEGADLLDGGDGNDLIYASQGDTVHGGDGHDWIIASDGVVRVSGDSGEDVLFLTGFSHAATIDLTAQTVVSAGQTLVFDVEQISGTDFGDLVYGSDLADDVSGGLGNDTITGGGGNDNLTGGEGADRFVYQDGWGRDWLADYQAGVDVIDLSSTLIASGDVTFTVQSGGTLMEDGAGNSIFFAGIAPADINLDDFLFTRIVQGSNGDDTLTGDAQDNVIWAGNGDDVLNAGAGADSVSGGNGDDTIDGGSGNDTIDGGAGADMIIGGDGQDLVMGGCGDDTVQAIFEAPAGPSSFISLAARAAASVGIDDSQTAGQVSLSDDGLTYTYSGGRDRAGLPGTEEMASGQWYWEVTVDDISGSSSRFYIGLMAPADSDFSGTLGTEDGALFLRGNGQLYEGTGGGMSRVARGLENLQEGDTIGIAYDADTGTVWLSVNGDWQNGATLEEIEAGDTSNAVATGLSGPYVPIAAGWSTSSRDSFEATFSFDSDDFSKTSPTGYTAYGAGAGGGAVGDAGDTLDGGDGSDWIDLSNASVGISMGATQLSDTGDTEIAGDIYRNFENIRGTNQADLLNGGNGDNIIVGGAGNDTLSGGNGDDTIQGGSGDDLIFGSTGTDIIDGGSGVNTVSFAHLSQGMNLSFGDYANVQVLVGTGGDDILYGTTGAETLQGGNGDDTIYGAAGADSLSGGNGDDIIVVSANNDGTVVEGGEGDDTIRVNADRAIIDLAAGTLVSAANSDQVVDFTNVEHAIGDLQDDTLRGNDGANRLDGRGGDDFITGGAGDDTLVGGAGADTFAFEAGFTSDVIEDFEAGTDTIDLSAMDTNFANLVITQVGGDTVVEVPNEGQITLNGIDAGTLTADDFFFGVLAYNGTANDDRLTGQFRDETLSGGCGDDTLIGNGGNDTLLGGNGDDLLSGGDGADVIFGGLGDDTVEAYAGAVVTGTGIDDSLTAGQVSLSGDGLTYTYTGGRDRAGLPGTEEMASGQWYWEVTVDDISGSSSRFYIGLMAPADSDFGGTLGTEDGVLFLRGNGQLYEGTGGGMSRVARGLENLQEGDTIGIAYDADTGTVWLSVNGDWQNGATLEEIEAGDTTNALATGLSGAYVPIAAGWSTSSRDGFEATFSFDSGDFSETSPTGYTAYGSAGAPVSGGDTVDGGDGFDVIDLSALTAAIDMTGTSLGDAGGVLIGDDLYRNFEGINGTDGGDILIGGSGNELLMGAAGDDTLMGGAGDDTLAGGAGADVIALTAGFGNDVITGFNIAADRLDVLALGVSFVEILANLTQSGADAVYSDGAGNSFTLLGVTASDVTAANFVVNGTVLAGTANADALVGRSDDEYVVGLAGDDTLQAMAGDDTILGGAGNDVIDAGAGDDTLVGGLGNDVLTGGAGNDRFVHTGAAADRLVITDFEEGDILDLADATVGVTSLLTIAEETTQGGEHGVLVGLYDGGQVFVEGVTLPELLEMNVLLNGAEAISEGAEGGRVRDNNRGNLVEGTAGDDYLDGRRGDDTIEGGAGNDTLNGDRDDDRFVFEAGSGNDVIRDFSLRDDILDIAGSSATFDTLSDVIGNAVESSRDGRDGVLIDLGGGDSVFLNGISLGDLTQMTIIGSSGSFGPDGNDDTIVAQSGADSFVFSGDIGNDVIRNYNPSEDSIDISAYSLFSFNDFAHETTVNGRSGVLLDLNDGNTLFVENVSAGELALTLDFT